MTTYAVRLEHLGHNDGDQPLCPACHGGRLHPYAVTFSLGRAVGGVHYTSERADYLEGWVAVCVGNRDRRRWQQHMANQYDDTSVDDPVEPCGFSMTLTPKQRRC